MATSTETNLTTTWVEVVDNANDYVLQNIGNEPIRLYWSASQPTTENGFEVAPRNGVDSTTFLAGPLWAKAARDVGKIIVNQ